MAVKASKALEGDTLRDFVDLLKQPERLQAALTEFQQRQAAAEQAEAEAIERIAASAKGQADVERLATELATRRVSEQSDLAAAHDRLAERQRAVTEAERRLGDRLAEAGKIEADLRQREADLQRQAADLSAQLGRLRALVQEG